MYVMHVSPCLRFDSKCCLVRSVSQWRLLILVQTLFLNLKPVAVFHMNYILKSMTYDQARFPYKSRLFIAASMKMNGLMKTVRTKHEL